MCGIIGYVGNEHAVPILLGALGCLEYPGYDSSGIATVANNKIWLEKDAGKLEDIIHQYNLRSLPEQIGIGHVRWATHSR